MIDLGLIVLGTLLGLGILSGILAVEAKELMHAVFFLGVLLVIIGEIYILLGAEFIGVVQILVYAGGVTVLMLFTLFFIPRTKDRLEKPFIRLPSLVIVLLLLSLIILTIGYVSPSITYGTISYVNAYGIMLTLSKLIMERFLFLVAIIALVIFVTMIAAAYISNLREG